MLCICWTLVLLTTAWCFVHIGCEQGRGRRAAVSSGGEKTRKHLHTDTITGIFWWTNAASLTHIAVLLAAAAWTKLIAVQTEPERKLKHCTKSIKQINYTENLAQHWIDCAKWNYKILHSIRASLLLKMAGRLVRSFVLVLYRSRCRSFILGLLVHTFVLARTDLPPSSSERAPHLALLFSILAFLSVFISVINFANFITLVKQPASQPVIFVFFTRRTSICNEMNSNCCFWSIIHLCYAFLRLFHLCMRLKWCTTCRIVMT